MCGNCKKPYQRRVTEWISKCFGKREVDNKPSRNHRFCEEALELLQACQMPKEDVLMLVDYVYDRAPGDKWKEAGDVQITLAALCQSQDIAMQPEAEAALTRNWFNINVISSRANGKPLPVADQE